MKKITLLFLLIGFFGFSQKKELLIGAISSMDFHKDLMSQRFYTTDFGTSKNALLPIWSDYKFELPNDDIKFSKDETSIWYEIKDSKVVRKSIYFESFAALNYFLFNLYKMHDMELVQDDDGNKYYFTENGRRVEFSTNFFAYGSTDIYDIDYKFFVEFKESTK